MARISCPGKRAVSQKITHGEVANILIRKLTYDGATKECKAARASEMHADLSTCDTDAHIASYIATITDVAIQQTPNNKGACF